MIAVAGIVSGLVFTSNAQITIGLTGGFGTAMDLAKARSSYEDKLASENGFGGGITSRYWLNKKMAAGINISYFSFGVKDVPSRVTSSYTVLPISIAFDYYFMSEGFKPFAGLEGGYMISSWIAKFDANYAGNDNQAF